MSDPFDALLDQIMADKKESKAKDRVNHPSHYMRHPGGIECIEIAEGFGFNVGNVSKYVWRADFKSNDLEDLEKARWYLSREINRRKRKAKEWNRA